jgi:hypothetical protein
MTDVEFKEQINKLVGFYGTNKFSEKVALSFWSELGGLSAGFFEIQIDDFIENSKKAKRTRVPTLEDFKTALFSQLNDLKRKNNEELKKKFADCKECKGSGIIPFYVRGDRSQAPYSFQCDCPLGEKLYPSFSKQFAGMGRTYVSHQELWAIDGDAS